MNLSLALHTKPRTPTNSTECNALAHNKDWRDATRTQTRARIRMVAERGYFEAFEPQRRVLRGILLTILPFVDPNVQ